MAFRKLLVDSFPVIYKTRSLTTLRKPVPSLPNNISRGTVKLEPFLAVPPSICLMNQIENESRQWGDRHLKQEMCARWGLPTLLTVPTQLR